MAYQSRKRKYLSRRERLQRDWRNIGVLALFALLAALAWLVLNLRSILAWLKTYTY
jgi:ferric-dicitrate binding protein FerR (iron transport regulator)